VLVTGAYHPEISAAAVQCRTVAAVLRDRVSFSVVATATDARLPHQDTVDDVPVARVTIDAASALSKAAAIGRLWSSMRGALAGADLVHIHGFSLKNLPVAAAARLAGKPSILHLHTAGQDEPDAIRRRGAAAWWACRSNDAVLAVSPLLRDRWVAGGLDAGKLRLAPNGVDVDRFTPADDAAKRRLRAELTLPDGPIVLFVGFFSRDKRPDALYRAWRDTAVAGIASTLVFVGAAGPTYYEIDASLRANIQTDAASAGLADRIRFAEPTTAIERYLRAADVFALPSIREAMPLSLLEAMACGLPCVASRLPGATDAIVDDGTNGRLVDPDDRAGWTGALTALVTDRAAAAALGQRARATVVERFSAEASARVWLAAYNDVLRRNERS
jgi:glycosyltransferase involved in cell wall biosynthesis